MAHDHITGCSAQIASFDDPPPWWCGRPAVGPHPDPDITYLQPLCRTHLIIAEDEGR